MGNSRVLKRTEASSKSSSSARAVLIVDDDPTLVESLVELLDEEGYAVEGFTDARLALARLAEGARPDLVLLDYLMPAMTGEEFLDALDRSGIAVEVVLFSALHDGALTSARARVAGIVRKPFDLDELLATVGRLSHAA
jgi:two-component system response regulator MprA